MRECGIGGLSVAHFRSHPSKDGKRGHELNTFSTRYCLTSSRKHRIRLCPFLLAITSIR